MVIGANVGTTVCVLLGSIGGLPAKKRVAISHLIFNAVTGLIAFLGPPALVWLMGLMLDVYASSLIGLALFHTLFNVLGVILFLPFVGLFSKMLFRLCPDYRPMVTI